MSDHVTPSARFLDRTRSLNSDYLVGYMASALTAIADDHLRGETAQEYARRVLDQLTDEAAVRAAEPRITSYACPEAGCGEVFVVDPADPMDAHGKYLDHLAKHDEEVPD